MSNFRIAFQKAIVANPAGGVGFVKSAAQARNNQLLDEKQQVIAQFGRNGFSRIGKPGVAGSLVSSPPSGAGPDGYDDTTAYGDLYLRLSVSVTWDNGQTATGVFLCTRDSSGAQSAAFTTSWTPVHPIGIEATDFNPDVPPTAGNDYNDGQGGRSPATWGIGGNNSVLEFDFYMGIWGGPYPTITVAANGWSATVRFPNYSIPDGHGGTINIYGVTYSIALDNPTLVPPHPQPFTYAEDVIFVAGWLNQVGLLDRILNPNQTYFIPSVGGNQCYLRFPSEFSAYPASNVVNGIHVSYTIAGGYAFNPGTQNTLLTFGPNSFTTNAPQYIGLGGRVITCTKTLLRAVTPLSNTNAWTFNPATDSTTGGPVSWGGSIGQYAIDPTHPNAGMYPGFTDLPTFGFDVTNAGNTAGYVFTNGGGF